MKQKPAQWIIVALLLFQQLAAQEIIGEIRNADNGEPVAFATVQDTVTKKTVTAGYDGHFRFEYSRSLLIAISATGFHTQFAEIKDDQPLRIFLIPVHRELDEIVVSGTLKAIKRSESPVVVEVYSGKFLQKNPAPSIFESLSMVNGVRPQINCSVCNTGDIHINGLEGPYTMVAIDGMPVMSSLAAVYGLFGIPSQLIHQVEIIKGPASALYGAEAIGGLINIITQSPDKGPRISGQWMSSSTGEHSLDAGVQYKSGKKAAVMFGVHGFLYSNPEDRNKDGFTDVALQQRFSVFNKWKWIRKHQRDLSLAVRLFTEDRWGGQLNWKKAFRGGDSIYGESIQTRRWELFGIYQLPVNAVTRLSYSFTGHHQDSWYGTIPYLATQQTGFLQLTQERKAWKQHAFITGFTVRGQIYDDNSTATRDTINGNNKPERVMQPGIFVQDEWRLNDRNILLLGYRADWHPVHGLISTPRIAWKRSYPDAGVFRFNAGTGFRVVSLFTEEHAALTGARVVEIQEKLRPEKSLNINVNHSRQFRFKKTVIQADISVWYSRFSNQIIPDYTTDPRKIIYANLKGHSRSGGITLNTELDFRKRVKAVAGVTVLNMRIIEKNSMGKKTDRPLLTEKWSGTWTITWRDPGSGFTADYTGTIYGPMLLPRGSALDPRPATSPVWSIQNLQLSKRAGKGIEFFCGIKNLLNWTPAKELPFLIARANDPFNKNVSYSPDGSVIATTENPWALQFDPSYIYAPNQARRMYFGIRFMRH